MGMKPDSNDLIMKIARWIVNMRKAFLVLFILGCIYGVICIPKVGVINDLTEYLPDTTETRIGLDLMDEEFVTLGTAKVLVSNITYENAWALKERLEGVHGVAGVSFFDADEDAAEDRPDSYKDACALYNITFDDEEESALSQAAIARVREILSEYQSYVYTTVDKDDAAELQGDMRVILMIVAVVIFVVLLFTSNTYIEIAIFFAVFLVAAILNMGTNYWFKEISFVTNAVGTVLQLALAIDYAIILLHRFMEERKQYEAVDAMTVALGKAIVEISSSSLTTISGMVALMLMQFQIGMDMGRVLMKAIIFSMLTVFLLMPALIVMSANLIVRTAHKSFVPKITLWGKLVVKSRFLTLPLFALAMVAAIFFSSKCHYIYDINSIESKKMNEFMASKNRIQETFTWTTPMAILVPKGDYQKEARILAEIEKIPEVDNTVGMSNTRIEEDKPYVLTDSLSPREFSEIADSDLDMIRILYRLYAVDHDQYSSLIKNVDDVKIPVVNMVDYMYEQVENDSIDFDDDQKADIIDQHKDLADARKQLEGENYSRLLFTFKGAVEGDETFRLVDQVREIALNYYEEAYVVGDSTSDYDLSKSFITDNIKISVLTALFVGIILLFTFKSAGLPFMLLITIQGSIWVNFSFPYLRSQTMFFLSYLIVTAIQMGATIDYAIVITNRYIYLRKSMADKKAAVVESLNQAFPTVITSGTILTCAAYVVGHLTSNATISSLGKTLGRGTLVSIFMVMLILPQILLVFDKLIDRTALSTRTAKAGKEAEDEKEK